MGIVKAVVLLIMGVFVMTYFLIGVFYGILSLTTLVYILWHCVFFLSEHGCVVWNEDVYLTAMIFDLSKIFEWRMLLYVLLALVWPCLIVLVMVFIPYWRDPYRNLPRFRKKIYRYFFSGFGKVQIN